MEEDSLMIVGNGGSTSIVVEGTPHLPLEEHEEEKQHQPSSPKVNGQPSIPVNDSEEVFIIVNKSTNIQKKVQFSSIAWN